MVEASEAQGSHRKAVKLMGPEYSWGEPPTMYQHFLAIKNLVAASIIEIEQQDPDAYMFRVKKAEGLFAKAYASLECAADFSMLEKAARLENVLRRDTQNPINELYNEAMDYQPIQDHAWKHVRMFQKGVRYSLMRISRITKGGLESFAFTEEKKFSNRFNHMRACVPIVLMRSAGTHDRHQTFTQFFMEKSREMGENEFDYVRPKDNHEIYGALMVLLDQSHFKRLRRYSSKRVRLADAMLVYGILGHGEPTTYLSDSDTGKKAYIDLGFGRTKEIPDEELYTLVNNSNLDWTSISPSQLLKIGQYLAKRDNLAVFKTETGLPPQIEKIYVNSGDLQRIKDDHKPLIYNIKENEKELLMTIRRLIAVIDLAEMLLPPHAAGDRKLLTPKAKNRYVTSAINPKDNSFNPGVYIDQLFNNDGHNCKSDLERQLFEAFEYLRVVQETGLLQDPELGEELTSLLVDAFCGTFWYFGNFVETTYEEQSFFINTSFRIQTIESAIKMYGKYGSFDTNHNPELLKDQTEDLLKLSADELFSYLNGYMQLKENKVQDLHRILQNNENRRKKMIETIEHKFNLENKNPLSTASYEQLFTAAAKKFASLLGVEMPLLHERHALWLSRSVQENIHASRVPWASSEQSVGALSESKTY